jgi:hypothetical protein
MTICVFSVASCFFLVLMDCVLHFIGSHGLCLTFFWFSWIVSYILLVLMDCVLHFFGSHGLCLTFFWFSWIVSYIFRLLFCVTLVIKTYKLNIARRVSGKWFLCSVTLLWSNHLWCLDCSVTLLWSNHLWCLDTRMSLFYRYMF